MPIEQLGDYRPFDRQSIMTYAFAPEMTGGVVLGIAENLSESDIAFVRRLYPGR